MVLSEQLFKRLIQENELRIKELKIELEAVKGAFKLQSIPTYKVFAL